MAVAGKNGTRAYRLNANGTLAAVGPAVQTGAVLFDPKWDNAGHVYAVGGATLYVFTLTSGGLKLTGTHGLSHTAGNVAVLAVQ